MPNELLKKIQVAVSPWRKKLEELLSQVKEQLGHERTVIGIDVGTSSVKVVQMAEIDGEMVILKSALVDIGGVPGSQEEVLASLRTAMIGMDTKGAKVAAVVNCPETCTRKILAPPMPKKELGQAVRWEAKNTIPFSIDEALMDFEIVGETADKNSKKLVVVVAAASKQTVNKLVTLFAKAGIEISSLIPVSLSMQNLMLLSPEWKKEIITVIEMGASLTELNIYREGRLAFSRKLPVAGRDITKALTSTLMSSQGKVELSMEEAEKIKKEQGIPSGEETEMIDGKILPVQILSLIRPCVEQLASEIERSFDFFREESRGGQVSKIILTGGGASLKGLVKALESGLEIHIEIGAFLKDIRALPKAIAGTENAGSRLNLALGAALNKGEKINLLPIELKEKTKRFIEKVSFKGIVTGIIGSLLLFYVGLHIQCHSYNKKISALKMEQRTLAPQIEALRSNIMVAGILKDKPHWEDVLKEISNLVPPEIYLTYLKAEDSTVSLKGDIIRGSESTQAVLSRFMLKLEEGIFQNVSLVTTQTKAGYANIAEFEIVCTVE
ncbi:MAG: type IV pilus assembly protein PilM [Candidatus Omnitrophica bacterium]|nr:type IV pilus assembly protein PilM [Candidatus Omnitrophota bacterium]